MILERRNLDDDASSRVIARFRVRAWSVEVVPLAAREGVWWDEHDDHADHWIVRESDEVLASARLCIHRPGDSLPDAAHYRTMQIAGRIAVFGRMVVAPAFRNRGIARRLDEARIGFARDQACSSCIASTSAGPSRLRALEALGFVRVCRLERTVTTGRPGWAVRLDLGRMPT